MAEKKQLSPDIRYEVETAGSILRLQAQHWQGGLFLDLRRWVTKDDGSLVPTKKGITLAAETWKELARVLEGLPGDG